MTLSDEEKQDIKRKIIDKLNEKYEMIAREVIQMQDDKLDELDLASRAQMEYDSGVSNELLTIRNALELEKDGTTTEG